MDPFADGFNRAMPGTVLVARETAMLEVKGKRVGYGREKPVNVPVNSEGTGPVLAGNDAASRRVMDDTTG